MTEISAASSRPDGSQPPDRSESPDASRPADVFAARPWLAHYQPGVPQQIEVPSITVDELLRRAAAAHPRRDALRFFGARTTFQALDRAVDRFAWAIRDLGLEPGDRVSLHLPTSPAFVIAYLGTLRAGCVAVPMNPLYVDRELDVLLRETTPRLSVVLDSVFPRVTAVRRALGDILGAAPKGVEAIATGVHDSMPLPIRWLYPLKARREGRWHPVPHSPSTPNLFRMLAGARATPFEGAARHDDVALLQPTGGTTGIPKAAILTHRNLVANALQVHSWFPAPSRDDDAILCVLPYFHIYGLTSALGYALVQGSTQLLHPRFDPHAVLESIARDRPKLFPGVPVMYATLVRHPDLPRHDLRSLEACISGAAPLPGPLQDEFEAITGGRVSEGYGLTEASPVTHCNPVLGERKIGTIGLPFPSTEARVVDLETGTRSLGIDEVGEICVRGPQVFRGYWNRPQETAGVLRDGWLYTGDVGAMDADGFFRIVDRRKDLVIVGGINVYPREIEEVLVAHPAVADAVVVAEPDPVKGELPLAFVVLRPGATASVDELLEHCRVNLARYKCPVGIEIRTELPRTMVGKVLRRVLAEERKARASQAGEVSRPTGPGGG